MLRKREEVIPCMINLMSPEGKRLLISIFTLPLISSRNITFV